MAPSDRDNNESYVINEAPTDAYGGLEVANRGSPSLPVDGREENPERYIGRETMRLAECSSWGYELLAVVPGALQSCKGTDLRNKKMVLDLTRNFEFIDHRHCCWWSQWCITV